MIRAAANSLLSIIYPQQCRVCSRQVIGLDAGAACASCWTATRIFDGTEVICAKCGSLQGTVNGDTLRRCFDCVDQHFDTAAAVGVYEKALAALIVNLKSEPHLPSRLRSAVEARLRSTVIGDVDVIIPIPLSRQRKHERGFNQAEVIAAVVARELHSPIDRSSLCRKVHTPAHRIAMDKRARELTVANAFEVVRPKLLAGKSVLLVDDVFTSGATASACAKVLKKNGAGPVNIFTLARAVLH